MGRKHDENDNNSKQINSTTSSTQKQDTKTVSNVLKYLTVAVIFFGNVTFVSLQIF